MFKQGNIAGLRSKASFSTWLRSSRTIDTSWKFCYNQKVESSATIEKMKVLLQSTQAEIAATITSWKFCYNRQAESFATIDTSWKCWRILCLRDDCFMGGKLFSTVTKKVFSMFVVIARISQWLKWEQINLSAHIVQQHFDWIALFIPVWNKFQKNTPSMYFYKIVLTQKCL